MFPPDHNQRDQFTATILQIFLANGQMISWGDRFAAPFELTSARWQMLGAIALVPEPLTAPQIAINMGVTRQGAQKQLNLLMDEGLVQKQPNPAHKRSPFYQLTSSGKTLYQQIECLWNQHAEQMAKNFSREDLATALKVLSQINTLYQASEQENDTL